MFQKQMNDPVSCYPFDRVNDPFILDQFASWTIAQNVSSREQCNDVTWCTVVDALALTQCQRLAANSEYIKSQPGPWRELTQKRASWHYADNNENHENNNNMLDDEYSIIPDNVHQVGELVRLRF
jgi:hypothetical protein